MEKRFLIVNLNGVFSALPSEDEYLSGTFLTSPAQFRTYEIAIGPLDLLMIHALRDDLTVLGPDLPLQSPEQITDPHNHYVQLVPYGEAGAYSLQRVEVPESAFMAEAREAKRYALSHNYEQASFAPLTFDGVTIPSPVLSYSDRQQTRLAGRTMMVIGPDGVATTREFTANEMTQLLVDVQARQRALDIELATAVARVINAATRYELSLV